MANTLSVSVQVANLQLSQPGVYEVVSVGPGGRSWRRHTVEGRYQHGRALIGSVMDTTTAVLVVRVYGATWAQVNTRTTAMIKAFSNRTYPLKVTINGVTHEWVCEPADIALVGGDSWQKFHTMAGMQEYQIMVPRSPVPLSGGM